LISKSSANIEKNELTGISSGASRIGEALGGHAVRPGKAAPAHKTPAMSGHALCPAIDYWQIEPTGSCQPDL
jgi:hypothetical protein